MAERIDIIITERGGRVVRRSITDIGGAAQASQSAVSLLTRALGALGGAFTALQAIRMVDTFTNLQNRLRTVTDSTEELAVVTSDLFEISNRTRSAYEGTVEVFARTALAAKELGVDQQTLLEVTESLNQAVILSGASAQEARNALIQLSQGLASGTLRGDELRSVLEQLPVVADVIAKGLGVTRGELRKLGEQGKITSADIIRAFEDAREELSTRFAETVPTIGQAFTVLRNEIIRFLGEVDMASGASSSFAQAIIFLSGNVENLGRIVGAAAITIGVVFAQQALGAATNGVRALTLAIAANPLGALLVAVTTGTSLLISFSDQLRISSDSAATLADVAVSAFDEIGDGIDALLEELRPFTDFVGAALETAFGELDASFLGVLQVAARTVDGIVGLWIGGFDAIVTGADNLATGIAQALTDALNAVSRRVAETVNSIISNINQVTEPLGIPGIGGVVGERFSNPLADGAQAAGQTAAEAFYEGFESVSFAEDTLNRIVAGAEERAERRLARQAEEQRRLEEARAGLGRSGPPANDPRTQQNAQLQRFLQGLEREVELLTLSNEQRRIQEALLRAEDLAKRELTQAERELIEASVRRAADLERQNELLEQIKGPQEQYRLDLEALRQLYEDGRISIEEYERAQRDLRIEILEFSNSAVDGAVRALLKLKKEYEDIGKTIEDSLTSVFRRLEDQLVDFVTSGKFNFKDFANFIIQEIARIAIRALIIKPILDFVFGAFGFGGGGLGLPGGGAGGSLFGGGVALAGGGLVSGPGTGTSDSINARLSNGEFVVNAAATQRNLGLLQTINGGGGIGLVAPPVSIAVYDQRTNSDSEAVGVEESTGPDGQRQIGIIIRDNVRRDIAGGSFDSAMRERYNLRPGVTRR